LREHKLYAKLSKCDFYNDKIQYLGHIVSKEGIVVDLEKIKSIMVWPIPKFDSDIRSFMGITGCYRNFIKGFSDISHPITSLKKKGATFIWFEKFQEILEKIKHLLTKTPILKIKYPYKDFIVCVNAFI
jgi:hypothetical protein